MNEKTTNQIRYQLYAFRDLKNGSYCYPFFCQNPVEATRMAYGAFDNEKTLMGQYPSDYEVWWIAQMVMETGRIENLQNPECIGSGISLLMAARSQQKREMEQLGMFEKEVKNER